jgi:hypothetical protein
MSGGPGRYHNSTSDEIVKTGPGILKNVTLTPAAALATLTLYDNTAASGTVITTLQAGANGPSIAWPGGDDGVAFSKGMYVVLTGAGVAASFSYI